MKFKEVRESALAALSNGRCVPTDEGWLVWAPCDWHPEVGHQAVCCNLVSHFETLDDLLREGTWCDAIDVPTEPSDDDDAEMLFRFIGLASLVLDQCVSDIRVVCDAFGASDLASSVKRLTDDLMAAVNHIWKHRKAPLAGRVMHRDHHHGPYSFADAGAVSPEAGLLVPSLLAAVNALVDVLLLVDAHAIKHPESVERLHATYLPRIDD